MRVFATIIIPCITVTFNRYYQHHHQSLHSVDFSQLLSRRTASFTQCAMRGHCMSLWQLTVSRNPNISCKRDNVSLRVVEILFIAMSGKLWARWITQLSVAVGIPYLPAFLQMIIAQDDHKGCALTKGRCGATCYTVLRGQIISSNLVILILDRTAFFLTLIYNSEK